MGKMQKPTGWKDNELHAVVRPTMLESKNSKIDLMKQSAIIGNMKKGKADKSQLPEGVVQSIQTKERIAVALSQGNVDVDNIRQRLNITGKPLSIKNARSIRDEINDRFEKNRNKTASKGVDLKGLKKELSKKEQRDIDPSKIAKARQPIGKTAKATPTKSKKAATAK